MLSSQQLSVGMKANKAYFRGAWIKWNAETGHEMRVAKNHTHPKSRLHLICYTNSKVGWLNSGGCRAHIWAVGDNDDCLEIISLDMRHTCGQDGSARATRKRNYKMDHIRDVSNVLTMYQPTQSRDGNARQFATMTKLATGVDLKQGQATRAIRGFCNDSIEAMIGQFMWIPSLMSTYAQDDASGTYILQDKKPCS